MTITTDHQDATRITSIRHALAAAYPHAKIALTYGTPWELLVAVVLSAQCTDKKVNEVTKRLFAEYPTLDAYADADPTRLETAIHATGFFRNKAKNIIAAARCIRERFGREVPRTMEEILTIPGVARKSANVILGTAYGVVEGIAVDTHVIRLSQRLRLVPMDAIGGKQVASFTRDGDTLIDYRKDADPVRIERALMATIPKGEWYAVTYRLIDHGRAVCDAKKPRCAICPLTAWCPASRMAAHG